MIRVNVKLDSSRHVYISASLNMAMLRKYKCRDMQVELVEHYGCNGGQLMSSKNSEIPEGVINAEQ